MKGQANYRNVKEQAMQVLLPEGEYVAEITAVKDKVTRNGDPMVAVLFTVIEGDWSDNSVWSNIVFLEVTDPDNPPKGCGTTKHFLHVIGEPYEGDFQWDSDNWKGRQLRITIKHEVFEGKTKNKVAGHDFLSEPEAPVTTTGDDPLAGTPFEE